MTEHAVQQSEPARLVESARALGEDPLADHHVAEQSPLVGQPELGPIGELAGAPEVVDNRRGQQQVRVQTRMQNAGLVGERGDRDQAARSGASSSSPRSSA